MMAPFLAGIVISAVVGILVIDVFLGFLRRNSLNVFVCYRVFFGILVVALAFIRGSF